MSVLPKNFENAWHIFVDHVKLAIVAKLSPAINFVTENGGQALVDIGETVVLQLGSDAPWKDKIAAVEKKAAEVGLKLAKGAAEAALNLAEANVIASKV